MREPQSFEVVYTEAIVRDAVRTYVLRRCIAEQWRLCALVGALVALFLWLLWTRGGDWSAGVAGSLALFPPAMIAMVWMAHHRATVGRFRRMPSPLARFGFGETGLAITSELGTGEIAFAAITEIWERPDYWMIFTGPNQFNILPLAGVAPEALERLKAKTRRAG